MSSQDVVKKEIKANIIEHKYTLEEQEQRKQAFIDKVNELAKSDLEFDEQKRFVYNYDNCIRLMASKNFVDLRLSEKQLTLEYFWGEEKYDMVWFSFKQLYDDLNAMVQEIGVNNVIDGKYFSFHIPLKKNGELYLQWFRGLFKTSIAWNEMTIRKLTTPRNLDDFIYDKVLIQCVLKGLLSRKGFAISWKTGSWKSTILISLLNFFNKSNYTDMMIKEIEGVIFEMLWEKKEEDKSNTKKKIPSKTLEFIKKSYHTLENLDMIKKDIHYCLMAIKQFIFNHYSRKGEILSTINIVNMIKLIVQKNENKNIAIWGEVIVKMFDEYAEEIQKRLIDCENKPINQAIKKFSLSRIRNITTLEEPIEYIYWKEGILRFYQHSLSQHFEGAYFEFINQILRDNPHVCYIAEVRNQEEIDTFLTSMSLWITSMTTCHSYDSIEVLLKFIDLSSKGSWEVMNILTNSFHTWINIEAYYFQSLKNVQHIVNGFIQWYDFLDFSDTVITTAFRNYYTQNNLGNFIQMLYDGNMFSPWKLNYYPKKFTLHYRLMLLWNEIEEHKKQLDESKIFNFEVFKEEMIDLIFNTRGMITENDITYLAFIYWRESAQKIIDFLRIIEKHPLYEAKKNALKEWKK